MILRVFSVCTDHHRTQLRLPHYQSHFIKGKSHVTTHQVSSSSSLSELPTCLCELYAPCVCVWLQLLTQGAFGYLLPIISFVLAWIETWLLDFKVLPQEAEDENSELKLGITTVTTVLPLLVL